jgi:hypothetical protein
MPGRGAARVGFGREHEAENKSMMDWERKMDGEREGARLFNLLYYILSIQGPRHR